MTELMNVDITSGLPPQPCPAQPVVQGCGSFYRAQRRINQGIQIDSNLFLHCVCLIKSTHRDFRGSCFLLWRSKSFSDADSIDVNHPCDNPERFSPPRLTPDRPVSCCCSVAVQQAGITKQSHTRVGA